MRIFATRHGQAAAKEYYNGDPSRPASDPPLSELGQEQARLVGKRLKELGFNGVIFSSPYERTLHTAELIAEELGTSFTPLACLREISAFCEGDKKNVGLPNASEIAAKYPHAQENTRLPYPWWENKTEELSDVIDRTKEGLQPVLTALPKDIDVLLVGHAATAIALRHLFACEQDIRGFHWNCLLSLLYSTDGETYSNDSAHLPEDMRTGNYLIYADNKKVFEKDIERIHAFLDANKGKKVLHIGDTESASYHYFKRLIDEIRPDVIVHTGDLADELKAGRVESTRPYWRATVPQILNVMENSGARVIIVPGNNDLEEELSVLAPKAEIVQRNTVLDLYGTKVSLCHELNRMDPTVQAQAYLYGHGLTGETRTIDDNERDGKLYYNAVWGISLHVFEANAHLIVPKIYV
ncbi:MAG: histidine phosphatase family protein [Clostridia bacterium]|nr:histidine phosphatase family protein [Clostridia bacterium]